MREIEKKRPSKLFVSSSQNSLGEKFTEWVRHTMVYCTPGVNVLATSLVRITK